MSEARLYPHVFPSKTFLKLTDWVHGTNLSTLERQVDTSVNFGSGEGDLPGQFWGRRDRPENTGWREDASWGQLGQKGQFWFVTEHLDPTP